MQGLGSFTISLQKAAVEENDEDEASEPGTSAEPGTSESSPSESVEDSYLMSYLGPDALPNAQEEPAPAVTRIPTSGSLASEDAFGGFTYTNVPVLKDANMKAKEMAE